MGVHLLTTCRAVQALVTHTRKFTFPGIPIITVMTHCLSLYLFDNGLRKSVVSGATHEVCITLTILSTARPD